jgi:hypothetical protein
LNRCIPGSRCGFRVDALRAMLLLALLPACSTSLPKPPAGLVPPSEMIEVPYPPPPARVEDIPPRKASGEVWIDGQWEWDGKAWKWREGAWMTPPPNAYFTPWMTKRRGDGQLLFARAEWRDKSGRPLNVGTDGQICSAPAPAPAPSTPEATKQ